MFSHGDVTQQTKVMTSIVPDSPLDEAAFCQKAMQLTARCNLATPGHELLCER